MLTGGYQYRPLALTTFSRENYRKFTFPVPWLEACDSDANLVGVSKCFESPVRATLNCCIRWGLCHEWILKTLGPFGNGLCLVTRERQWLTMVALCYRVEAMRGILQKNQMIRSAFDRQKVAAFKIGSWYKAILIERRRQQLLETCIKLRKFVRPAIVFNRERARKACAARIFHFIKQLRDSNQVSLAVKRFKHMVITIQR